MPQLDRPYKIWFYPITPILYLLVAALVVGSSLFRSLAKDASTAETYQVPAVAALMAIGLALVRVFPAIGTTEFGERTAVVEIASRRNFLLAALD